jgi:hypothetical protein
VKISLLRLCGDLRAMEKEKTSMRLFRRKKCAVKNWHARALMIDPNKTRITIVIAKTTKQVPLWVYRKYAPLQLSAS